MKYYRDDSAPCIGNAGFFCNALVEGLNDLFGVRPGRTLKHENLIIH